eukprot:4332921-Alexandrium_andersonii.AAC.1
MPIWKRRGPPASLWKAGMFLWPHKVAPRKPNMGLSPAISLTTRPLSILPLQVSKEKRINSR